MKSGKVALIPATLNGQGHTARCEILARKHTVIRTWDDLHHFAHIYTNCSIIGAPVDMPDGDYKAQFDGVVLRVTCQSGIWFIHENGTDWNAYPLAS